MISKVCSGGSIPHAIQRARTARPISDHASARSQQAPANQPRRTDASKLPATQPITPVPSAPERRKLFTVIKGGKE
jgi:hypothetical protein